MTQICSKCSRVNPPEAAYCYHDGAILEGHLANGGPINQGSASFPSQFVFPSGQVCRNFDQLALACQQNWKAAVDLLKQGFLAGFLGGLGRADLALAAQEAAGFPDHDRGLDQLLSKLPSQALEAPKLKVEPSEINLGQIAMGSDRQIDLHLSNLGMRLLFGSVASDCKWLTLGDPPGHAQKIFQFGADTTIPVQIRGQHLRAGNKPLEGHLVIESNGGSTTVLVRADVPAQPFKEGVLVGALTPRQIAEKALKLPKEAAPLFEKGAVAEWFKRNGWTYPVQGPAASGLGAVQQFFEALGLAKAPKVEIGTPAINLKGRVGEVLQTTLEVRTPAKRPVYAYASCDQGWVEVNRARLQGRFATIPVRIPSVPNRPGETLQANLHVTGNGNQRFVVPLTLTIEASSPFADLMPVEAVVAAEPYVPAAGVYQPAAGPAAVEPVVLQAAEPMTTGAANFSPPGNAFADLGSSPLPTSTPALVASQGQSVFAGSPPLPRQRRETTPVWMHLLPLGLLALALGGVMVRDLIKGPGGGNSGKEDLEYRIGLYFDYSPNKEEVKKLKLTQTMSFGLVKIDDPSNPRDYKKLTYDHRGRTNSTMVKIDGFEKTFGKTTAGRWEEKPAHIERGMTASWLFHEQILVTQTVEIIPGEPVEVGDTDRRFLDACLVRFQVENQDTLAHRVGLRILLDTLIGENDGPTFTVPGLPDLVNTNRDFRAPEQRIPDFVQALEKPNIQNPGTVAQFNFRLGNTLEVPSRVSLTHWPGHTLGHLFDIPVRDIKDDSAVAIYWKEDLMAPGKKRLLGFSAGLGNVSSAEGQLGLSVGGSFAPGGELTVVALVNDPKPGQEVTLKLPAEFTFVEGSEATQKVPPASTKLPDGRFRPSPVTWRVRSTVNGVFHLEVLSSGSRLKQRVTIKTSTLF